MAKRKNDVSDASKRADCDRRIQEQIERWIAHDPLFYQRDAQTAAATTTNSDQLVRLERFSRGARQLVVEAQKLADQRHHGELTMLHLLHGLLLLEPCQELCQSAEADAPSAIAAAEAELATLPTSNEPSYLSRATLQLLQRLEREAEGEVSLTQLLRALVSPPPRTLDDLDRDGLVPPSEQLRLRRVIDAGRLTRLRAN